MTGDLITNRKTFNGAGWRVGELEVRELEVGGSSLKVGELEVGGWRFERRKRLVGGLRVYNRLKGGRDLEKGLGFWEG